MGEIVNLRCERRRAVRAAEAAQAAANRVLHGTPRALREAAAREVTREAAQLDQARLDDKDAPAQE